MTTKDCNNVICQWLGFKLKADKQTWEINDKKFQEIFNVKSSKCIDFLNTPLALLELQDRVSAIKDVSFYTQSGQGEFHAFLGIGGIQDENTGDFGKYTFSCERNKPLNKRNQALFEVLSTFCGWNLKNPSFRSDIHWELARVGTGEDDFNIQYLEPIEVKTHCPYCGSEMKIAFNDLKPLEIKDLK